MTAIGPIMDMLVDRRRALGLRQADVAAAVGVSQQEISKWEAGRFVTMSGLNAYADVVGLVVLISLTPKDDENVPPAGADGT